MPSDELTPSRADQTGPVGQTGHMLAVGGQGPGGSGADAVLADGGTVHIRPIRPDDEPNLRATFDRLSEETVYFRFHSLRADLTAREYEHFTHVDYDDRMALVAELGTDVIAVARYERLDSDPTSAEVAFTVEDAHQGRGVGTLLFEHLAAYAQDHGVERFVAQVLAENVGMIRVFEEVGLPVDRRADGPELRVTIPLAMTEKALAAIEEREVRAGARSVARLLAPKSIAVIGAGRERGNIGHEILRNLISGEFQGSVTPVHPTATSVASIAAVRSLGDIRHDIDVAVIAVPAESMLDVASSCAEKGVRALVVISAGFAETGSEGAAREAELVAYARRNGMRLVGPNCLGILNTHPGVQMNATFAPTAPTGGHVGFLSQSGALGIAILQQSASLGLGISSFVSIGNRADVSANDLLEYWEHDESTHVALLYLESFGNPRRFGRLARRMARHKPIVAVKAGRTGAGTRAAASHTAAMASSEAAVDALFRQAGVIRVDTLWQLFDVARLLDHQPLPAGRRVAIVSNGGGPAILAADACERAGLEVAELSATTTERLDEVLPEQAVAANPVDLIASAGPGDYERALGVLLDAPEIDTVIVGFTPPIVTQGGEVAEAVLRAARERPAKPVVANFLDTSGAGAGAGGALMTDEITIPSFLFPEAAAQALAHVADYAAWRFEPEGHVPEFTDVDVGAARDLVTGALASQPDGCWLDAPQAFELLGCFGIPAVPTLEASTAEEVLDRARSLPGPYVLKAASGRLVHKTELGALRLGLATPEEVAGAWIAMREQLGDEMDVAVVQPLVPTGVETIVGVVHDADFGPLVMFGMGGTSAELLGDRAFRILPITDRDAADLVRRVRGAPLLAGYRGSEPVDLAAMESLLVRVGLLADALPEIAELDLNPVAARPEGVTVLDAKVRLAPRPTRHSPYLRRLD